MKQNRTLLFCGRNDLDLIRRHDRSTPVPNAATEDLDTLEGPWGEILITSGEEETFNRVCKDMHLQVKAPRRIIDLSEMTTAPWKHGVCVTNYGGPRTISLFTWSTEEAAA